MSSFSIKRYLNMRSGVTCASIAVIQSLTIGNIIGNVSALKAGHNEALTNAEQGANQDITGQFQGQTDQNKESNDVNVKADESDMINFVEQHHTDISPLLDLHALGRLGKTNKGNKEILVPILKHRLERDDDVPPLPPIDDFTSYLSDSREDLPTDPDKIVVRQSDGQFRTFNPNKPQDVLSNFAELLVNHLYDNLRYDLLKHVGPGSLRDSDNSLLSAGNFLLGLENVNDISSTEMEKTKSSLIDLVKKKLFRMCHQVWKDHSYRADFKMFSLELYNDLSKPSSPEWQATNKMEIQLDKDLINILAPESQEERFRTFNRNKLFEVLETHQDLSMITIELLQSRETERPMLRFDFLTNVNQDPSNTNWSKRLARLLFMPALTQIWPTVYWDKSLISRIFYQ